MKYKLALKQWGLPEYEGSVYITSYAEVEADTLREAKQKWAETILTPDGTRSYAEVDERWDKEQQTYWGWEVVEIK